MVAAENHHIRPQAETSPLAIVAGSGSLPFVVADTAAAKGRSVVIFALRDAADPERVARYPHHWIRFGQIGRAIRIGRREGCRDAVLIGGFVRPAIARMRFDLGALRYLPRLARLLRGGDNQLLSGLADLLNEEGFHLLGAHEIAPQILMPKGPLGARGPVAADWPDIRQGLALLRAIGPFDVGQAVVVAENRVLAVEGAEGTDEMLTRLAALRERGRVRWSAGHGVLVKALKPGQDRRIDLPSIGPRTVEFAARASLAGIAVTAESAVIAEPQQMAEAADRAGLFVIGVDADAAAS